MGRIGHPALVSKEVIQDNVGNILTDTATINFTYDDANNTITADVIGGGVDHGGLAGLNDDDHTQYIKDSEFTQDSGILVGTGVGTFAEETGATLRTSIGVDVAGTDNSTNVTLTGTPDYITIIGQVITRNQIDLVADVTGILPVANGGTNVSSASITAFNNITGYTASGATGTTSTNLVFSTSPTLVTPALGTPSALVGTNISGTAANLTAGAVTNATLTTALTVNTGTLTLTANVANTSVLTIGAGAVSVSGTNTGDNTVATALTGTPSITVNTITTTGNIELGHASDTTIARVSAGLVSIEGSNILTAVTGAAIGQTMYIGTTATTINRASAAQTLAGLTLTTPELGVATGTSIDFGTTTLLASRALTVDTGGVFNIVLASAAGDDFTVDTNKLVVEGDTGNVGIGTTGPAYQLEVSSDNAAVAVRSVDVANIAFLGRIGTTGSDMDYGKLLLKGSGGTTNISLLGEGVSYFNSGNVGIGTTGPTNILSLSGEAARIFWMERELTANTAGNTLTVTAGGATASATNKAGGALILQGGLSTGSAESGVTIQGVVAGASGTADRTQTTAIQVLGNKIGFFSSTPVVRVAAYTPTNVSTDRSYDADTVAVAELADVVGTLIADLQSYGLLQ